MLVFFKSVCVKKKIKFLLYEREIIQINVAPLMFLGKQFGA